MSTPLKKFRRRTRISRYRFFTLLGRPWLNTSIMGGARSGLQVTAQAGAIDEKPIVGKLESRVVYWRTESEPRP